MALIVWNIVKWILWILLFLLLFLVCAVCLVLFVPVRYRIHGRVEEKTPDVAAKVTWLLHLVSVRFEWKAGIRLRIRIFGIPVFDSARPAKEKKRPGKKDHPPEAVAKTEANMPSKAVVKAETNNMPPEIEKNAGPETMDSPETQERNDAEPESEEAAPPKKTLREKISALRSKLAVIRRKAADIKVTIERFAKIWKREETQAAFALCKNTLGKAINAILPKEWSVTGIVGFEDPSATGYMMAGLGIGHPFFGNHIMITPDFEHSVLQLAGKARGRIAMVTLVWQALRIITNSNCRKFLKLISSAVSGQNQEVEKHGRE